MRGGVNRHTARVSYPGYYNQPGTSSSWNLRSDTSRSSDLSVGVPSSVASMQRLEGVSDDSSGFILDVCGGLSLDLNSVRDSAGSSAEKMQKLKVLLVRLKESEQLLHEKVDSLPMGHPSKSTMRRLYFNLRTSHSELSDSVRSLEHARSQTLLVATQRRVDAQLLFLSRTLSSSSSSLSQLRPAVSQPYTVEGRYHIKDDYGVSPLGTPTDSPTDSPVESPLGSRASLYGHDRPAPSVRTPSVHMSAAEHVSDEEGVTQGHEQGAVGGREPSERDFSLGYDPNMLGMMDLWEARNQAAMQYDQDGVRLPVEDPNQLAREHRSVSEYSFDQRQGHGRRARRTYLVQAGRRLRTRHEEQERQRLLDSMHRQRRELQARGRQGFSRFETLMTQPQPVDDDNDSNYGLKFNESGSVVDFNPHGLGDQELFEIRGRLADSLGAIASDKRTPAQRMQDWINSSSTDNKPDYDGDTSPNK